MQNVRLSQLPVALRGHMSGARAADRGARAGGFSCCFCGCCCSPSPTTAHCYYTITNTIISTTTTTNSKLSPTLFLTLLRSLHPHLLKHPPLYSAASASLILALIMKFSTIASSLASVLTFASAASAAAVERRGLIQNPFGSNGLSADDKPVPGDSPVELCDPFVPKLLTIDHINLSPNPPEKGSNLTIEASGVLHETVEEGAYINVQVNYGYIRLLTQTFDLCEELGEVDLKCPLKAGPLAISKIVELPDQIPPGKYVAVARAYTKSNKAITCLSAEVNFPVELSMQF